MQDKKAENPKEEASASPKGKELYLTRSFQHLGQVYGPGPVLWQWDFPPPKSSRELTDEETTVPEEGKAQKEIALSELTKKSAGPQL